MSVSRVYSASLALIAHFDDNFLAIFSLLVRIRMREKLCSDFNACAQEKVLLGAKNSSNCALSSLLCTYALTRPLALIYQF